MPAEQPWPRQTRTMGALHVHVLDNLKGKVQVGLRKHDVAGEGDLQSTTRAETKRGTTPTDPHDNATRWRKPEGDTIKLNCDGAWCPTAGQDGVGVIARDSSGTIKGGRQGAVRGGSVEEVKALSILEGIQLAVEKNWHNVVVETDAMTVINHIGGNGFVWRIQTIADNLKALASSLRNVSWETIPRSANQYAD